MLRESGLKEAPAGRAKAPQPLPPPPPPAQMAASVVPLAAPSPLPKRGAGPRRGLGVIQQSPAAAESSRIKQQIFEARTLVAILSTACLRASCPCYGNSITLLLPSQAHAGGIISFVGRKLAPTFSSSYGWLHGCCLGAQQCDQLHAEHGVCRRFGTVNCELRSRWHFLAT